MVDSTSHGEQTLCPDCIDAPQRPEIQPLFTALANPLRRRSVNTKDVVPVRVLGAGYYGIVDLVEWHGSQVARKRLLPLNGPELTDRQKMKLKEEAALLAEKRHANILQFYRYCSTENYFLTEYCANGSLFDARHDRGKRHVVESMHNRLRWLEETASACCYLHHEEPLVLHRDIKSSNVFLDQHFTAKLGDLGLARVAVETANRTACVSGKSSLGHLYLAPEVMNSKSQDLYTTKSDVYSFGVLIQELMTLGNPYGVEDSDHDVYAAMFGVIKGTLRPTINDDRSQLPGEWDECLEPLVDLMNQCCSRDPNQRPDFKLVLRQIKQIRADYARRAPAENSPICPARCIVKYGIGALILVALVMLVMLSLCGFSLKSSSRFTAISVLGWLTVCLAIIFFTVLGGCDSWPYVRRLTASRTANQSPEIELTAHLRTEDKEECVEIVIEDGNDFFASPENCRRYPVSQNWPVFLEHLLIELKDSPCEHAPAIRRLCRHYLQIGTMDANGWLTLLRHIIQSPTAQNTEVWKTYEEDYNIEVRAIEPVTQPCVVARPSFGAGPSTPPVDIPGQGSHVCDMIPGSSSQRQHSLMFETMETDVETGQCETPIDRSHTPSAVCSEFAISSSFETPPRFFP